MTRKAIHYSHHAIREMRKADVRRQHVRHVLATAERWVAEITPRDTYYGKTARVGRRRDVTVIYLEDAHRVLVVTV